MLQLLTAATKAGPSSSPLALIVQEPEGATMLHVEEGSEAVVVCTFVVVVFVVELFVVVVVLFVVVVLLVVVVLVVVVLVEVDEVLVVVVEVEALVKLGTHYDSSEWVRCERKGYAHLGIEIILVCAS